MRNSTKLFVAIISVLYITTTQAMEYGRHDGGDYCFYVPGSRDNRIYPTAREKRMLDLQDGYFKEAQPEFVKDRAPVHMNFAKIREMFPIVHEVVNTYPVTYLDSGATAQMPEMVLDAMIDYYMAYKSNAGRGLYLFAEKTTRMVEETRVKVAQFIGAKKQEVVFTQGATAALNLVAHSWAKHHLQPGDEIIVSEVEHNANFIPWQQLALQKGLKFTMVPINDRGVVDPGVLKSYVSEKTKLVALFHQSNVLGTTNDIETLAQVAHSVGAKIVVDAAQSIAHQKIDVKAMNCDFLAFSAHKAYGPTGIGCLYVNENLFDQCIIENFGGGMVYDVWQDHSEFKQMPHCMEAGTQPIAQIIGLNAVVDFMQKHLNFEQVQEHETKLACRLIKHLQENPDVTIISPVPAEGEHTNLVTFFVKDWHCYDLAQLLNEYGIAVRAGYHCVHLYHDKVGACSIRVTFSVYNTEQEVDFFAECLQKLIK